MPKSIEGDTSAEINSKEKAGGNGLEWKGRHGKCV